MRSPTTDLDSAHKALDHMLVSVREHAWPNVPSVTVAAAEVKLVVLVDEPGRIEGNPAGVHVPAVDVLRQHRRADIGADGAADLLPDLN